MRQIAYIMAGALLITTQTSLADSSTQAQVPEVSEATAVQKPINSQSPLSLKPSIQVGLGSSSNATLLSTPTPGVYGKISPSLSGEYTLSKDVTVDAALSGSIKRFTDRGVGPLADEHTAELRNDWVWSVTDAWELGSNLGFVYAENHLPVNGVSGPEALLQRYMQPDARLYAAWTGEVWSMESGIGGNARRYSTDTIDLLGNPYRSSFNEYKFDTRVGYRVSKGTRFGFKASLEKRGYTDRQAEFSEGLPVSNGITHPILSIFASDQELSGKFSWGSLRLLPSISLRIEKDLAYGARDSVRWKVKQRASIPLPWKVTAEPEVSLSKQAFSNFRSDPIGNPQNSPLRADWETQLGTSMNVPVSSTLGAQLKYAFNRKLSNFTLENYQEHVVETGMDLRL